MWTGEERERRVLFAVVNCTDPETGFVRVVSTKEWVGLGGSKPQRHLNSSLLSIQGINCGFCVFPRLGGGGGSLRHTGVLHY